MIGKLVIIFMFLLSFVYGVKYSYNYRSKTWHKSAGSDMTAIDKHFPKGYGTIKHF